MHRALLLPLLLLALAGGSCSRQIPPANASGPSVSENVRHILEILNEMPDGSTFGRGKPHLEERAKIEQEVNEIAQYDLDTIRSAIAYYCQADNLDADKGRPGTGSNPDKLFPLVQYLFNLPEKVTRDSPYWRFFGSWHVPFSGDPRHPRPSDSVDYRWPWSIDSDGRCRLTGVFGGYEGEAYQPVAAFDFYRKHFSRRVIDAGEQAAEAGP